MTKPNLFTWRIFDLFVGAFLIWLVPLVVSFGMYSPEGQLMVNYWVFKLVMVVIASLTSYFVLRRYYTKYSGEWIKNSIIILTVNVFLDLIVLIGLLKMDLVFYLYSVVPVYIVFILATNYWLVYKSTDRNKKE